MAKTINLHSGKGSPITWAEMDQNMKLFLPEIYKYVDMESVLLAATNMIDGDWVYATDTDKCGRYFNGAIKWFTTKNFRPFFNNLAPNMQGQIDINFASPSENSSIFIDAGHMVLMEDSQGKYCYDVNLSDYTLTKKNFKYSSYIEDQSYIYTFGTDASWQETITKRDKTTLAVIGAINYGNLGVNSGSFYFYNGQLYILNFGANNVILLNFPNNSGSVVVGSSIVNNPVPDLRPSYSGGVNTFLQISNNYLSGYKGIYKISFNGTVATFTLVSDCATEPVFKKYIDVDTSGVTYSDFYCEGHISTDTHTYFFNGGLRGGDYPKNLSYKIDHTTEEVTKLPSASYLNTECAANYNSADGFIYVSGGCEDGWWDVTSQRVQIFDPINEIWLDQI